MDMLLVIILLFLRRRWWTGDVRTVRYLGLVCEVVIDSGDEKGQSLQRGKKIRWETYFICDGRHFFRVSEVF